VDRPWLRGKIWNFEGRTKRKVGNVRKVIGTYVETIQDRDRQPKLTDFR
jgi:hypothetical protein